MMSKIKSGQNCLHIVNSAVFPWLKNSIGVKKPKTFDKEFSCFEGKSYLSFNMYNSEKKLIRRCTTMQVVFPGRNPIKLNFKSKHFKLMKL